MHAQARASLYINVCIYMCIYVCLSVYVYIHVYICLSKSMRAPAKRWVRWQCVSP